ncbi:MAG: type II toxin-antitoxin system RelE/ParE family toxin [Gallionella sp.]|nr:type II toxin-antitoxin system RelE/ParE family toxin [Gallionella sp.]MDD4945416.1 type II toxin-antitoxin system RelE/ParE family toxin [Gallionella sp.]MDD5612070.1 type II toxin-antitoxin system RelE/ParE family toxin [Gallionella sp.]
MNFKVRYTQAARDDLKRLFGFLAARDLPAAQVARAAIAEAMRLLQQFPFSCRKANAENPFLRELLIPFGATGYVALFEIENTDTVTILAVRHQREDDYH